MHSARALDGRPSLPGHFVAVAALSCVAFTTGCRACGGDQCGPDRPCEQGSACNPQTFRCEPILDASVAWDAGEGTDADAAAPTGTDADAAATADADAGGTSDDGGATPDGATGTDGATDAGPAVCGNGFVEAPEACDDGGANSETAPDACRLDCTAPRCGDGVVDSGETCDDGNAVDGDGCTACALDACGNAALDPGEECDDGANVPADGCSATCALEPGACFASSSLACNSVSVGSTSGGPAAVSDWTACVPAFTFDGSEATYSFVAPSAGDVHLRISGLSDDLDLFVVDGAAGCAASACLAGSINAGTFDETIDVAAVGGATYYVVVDAVAGADGPFTLALGCGPEACTGGIDEDLDYLADCLDTDCFGDAACAGTCLPVPTLACGDAYSGYSAFAGSTDALDTYPCAAEPTVGPEFVHAFASPVDADVTVTLSGLTGDLDLIVLEETGAGCGAASACVASAQTRGAFPEALTFAATAGTTYYLVADGYDPGPGASYTLDVACGGVCTPVATPLDCATARSGSNTGLGSTDEHDAWSCVPSTPGAEIVYAFTAPYDGTVSADLVPVGMSAGDLDLAVIADSAGVCLDAAACLASSATPGVVPEQATWLAVAGETYYVAVDATAAATSSLFALDLICDAVCTPAATIACGDTISARNDDPGSADLFANWSCDPGLTGPEIVYVFTPTAAGMVTVTLSGLTADLDLVVLDAAPGHGCGENAACMEDARSGTIAETVTFAADPTHTYFLVIDGFGGATGSFSLAPSCP